MPIDVIDAYLSRELPLIGKEIREVLEEPRFVISNLGRFYMSIIIIAACDEKDMSFVKKELLRKLKERLDVILAPYLEKINLSELSITIE